MKRPLVSCIVVTYNSAKYIQACLKALQKVTYPNLEILVVDNGSSDETLKLVKSFGSKIKLYLNPENGGYAGGHTFGIQKARGEYFFLLNPDTTVTVKFLEPLVTAMESDSQRAACQPLVYLAQSPNEINLSGKVTHYLGFDWLRDYQSKKVRPSGEIISFGGAGILLRATALEKVGGFDSTYFMYYEDGDLSWRLRLNGFKLWYCAESVVYHDYKFVPDEQNQTSTQKLFWAERNRLYTCFKNYELSTICLVVPMLLLIETGLLCFLAAKGLLKAKLNSYISLWRARKNLAIARKQVQLLRTVTDRGVMNDFETEINFSLFHHPLITYVLNPILFLYWQLIWPLI